jgi:uncharacterized protein (TIGR02328 family)
VLIGKNIVRLWHEKLIPYLPRQQLLGLHRECCAMRGLSWGRKHSTVDYVWKYFPYRLFLYHCLVVAEMTKRRYKHNKLWDDSLYRGKRCLIWKTHQFNYNHHLYWDVDSKPIYPEHNDEYLRECLINLTGKGIVLNESDLMNEEV